MKNSEAGNYSIFQRSLRAAAAAWLSSTICFIGLSTPKALAEVSTPTSTPPASKDATATEALAKPSQDTCELLSKGPGVDLTSSEVTLHNTLEAIMSDLNSKELSKFSRHFHPKARVKSDIGDKLKSIISSRYDTPWQFSIFRVWRLKSPSAGKPLIDTCPEGDGARIIGAFGYEKQYAVWIQIMGQNELGRLILSIAPDKGRDLIVGFRIQQWTQSGADWRAWAGKAEEAEAKKDLKEAYLNYDISQKLIDGKDLVVYPVQAEIIKRRDALKTKKKIVEEMNQDLKINSIAYVGTLLAKEGTGIFIREYIKAERPAAELHDLCLRRGETLKAKAWLKESQTLRCNFIFKGMDPEQDSQLGGFFFTPEDLRKPKK